MNEVIQLYFPVVIQGIFIITTIKFLKYTVYVTGLVLQWECHNKVEVCDFKAHRVVVTTCSMVVLSRIAVYAASTAVLRSV
jgi:hypothetical protein